MKYKEKRRETSLTTDRVQWDTKAEEGEVAGIQCEQRKLSDERDSDGGKGSDVRWMARGGEREFLAAVDKGETLD